MSVSVHVVAAVADDGTDTFPLDVTRARVRLDDSWTPYGQITLTVARPPDATIAALDPRAEDDVRVTVTLERTYPLPAQSRDFDMLLVSRELDARSDTLTLELATDEAILQGDAYLGTTPDDSAAAEQGDLRALIDEYVLSSYGFSLAADDGATADLTIYADETNLLTNPSGEVDTAGWTASACTLVRTASVLGISGAYTLRLHTPASQFGYMQSDAIAVNAGETYVLAGWVYSNGTASGTAYTYPRSLVLVVDGTSAFIGATSQGPATGGDYVTGEITIPTGVTSVRVRAFHGTTVGDIRWDAMKFALKTETLDPFAYFDGDTTDSDIYTYAWTGTAHASTSVRTNVSGFDGDPRMFYWLPGQTAWDYILPMVNTAGLRLYCDEQRVWHLVDPAAVLPDTLIVSAGVNATAGADTISRYSEWYDAVSIHYRWTDPAGLSHEAWDTAQDGVGACKSVLALEYDTAYPGAGAAAALLARSVGRGRVLRLDAVSDYEATPTMAVQAYLKGIPVHYATLSAVEWNLPDDQMTLRTRDGSDAVVGAWEDVPPGLTWADVDPAHTWADGVPTY